MTILSSTNATPISVLARLRDHPFAHIVSHRILNPGKPHEASFKLQREAPVARHCKVSIPRCRVRVPVRLPYCGADRQER